jgi:hypothetical protein
MSRSTRQPIVKDRPRNYKKSSAYWRRVRRRQKQEVDLIKTFDEVEISNPKEVINDYDYCDYIFRDCEEKYKRK